jgi:hypothetical protein
VQALSLSIRGEGLMLIQITTISGELVETIIVDRIPREDVIVYSPCGICGELVKAPRKFCSLAHKQAYYEKRIGSAN